MAERKAKVKIRLTINKKPTRLEVYPMERLLDVLRDHGLTGTKEGCGEGECGACSVFLDGELVNSCLVPAIQADKASVTTIEGLGKKGLHKVQRAFLERGGAQCGICTPGMVLAAVDLLSKHRRPSDEEIREGLAGNLCRCTGFTRIFEAVKAASKEVS